MITLALIGTGKWATNYLQTAYNNPGYTIKYVVSPHIFSKNLSSQYIQFKTHENLFAYHDIDGVIIATPAHTHYRIAKDFISKRIPVLIEKPFVANLNQARSLEKIWQASPSLCSIGYIYLSHNAFLGMQSTIKKIGRIRYMVSEAGKYDPNSSSLLWEWGSHDVAMHMAIMQDHPYAVSAWGVGIKSKKSYTMIMMQLLFRKNVRAYITLSNLFHERKRNISVYGTLGTLSYDDTVDNKLIFVNRNGTENIPTERRAPLEIQLSNFILAIKNKRNKGISVPFGVKVTEILDKAEKSLLENGKMYNTT